MTRTNPICSLCEHLASEGLSCTAFPKGIPHEIISGQSLHLRERDDDRGLQFRLAERHRDVAKAMVANGLYPEAILRKRSAGKQGKP